MDGADRRADRLAEGVPLAPRDKWGTAALLASAALALLAAPQDVPGLLIPNGAQHTMHSTKSMS